MDSCQALRACTVPALKSIRAFRSENKHGIMRQHCDDRRNEVQGTPALAVARECTLLLIQAEVPVHAPCLHSSRFGRPRREAHAVSCQRSTHGIMSDFAKGRFGSSPVRNFPLESIGIFRPLGFFRPTPRKNIWSNLVQSFLVRCQGLGIQDLTPVSHECTVPGLMESIRAFRSENKHGIM